MKLFLNNKKQIFIYGVIVFAFLLSAVGFSHAIAQNFHTTSNQIVFTVTVPETTPAFDSIYLHYHGKKILLSKIARHQYQGAIDTSNFSPGESLLIFA